MSVLGKPVPAAAIGTVPGMLEDAQVKNGRAEVKWVVAQTVPLTE
jgi:hypothetical protein